MVAHEPNALIANAPGSFGTIVNGSSGELHYEPAASHNACSESYLCIYQPTLLRQFIFIY